MNFYTNVSRVGNFLCIREIRDGIRHEYKCRYKPTLYINDTNSDEPGKYRTMNGDPVRPVTFNTMQEAREYVKQYEGVGGFDLYGQTDYILQFINQTYTAPRIKFDSSRISAWTIDIETRVPTDSTGRVIGFPDVETADCEVTIITLQNINTGRCFSWGGRPFNGVADTLYTNCGSERGMFKTFMEFWEQQSVEVVTGWNIEKFDMPYLLRRMMDVLGEELTSRLSPWGGIEFRKIRDKFSQTDAPVVDISGVSILDYMNLYKKFGGSAKHESYSLNHIAHEELGFQKLDHSEYTDFNDFYDRGFDSKYVSYNVIDVQLVSKLEAKLKLLELAYTMAYMAKINYAQVFGPVKTWDSIIHNRLIAENVVVPLRVGNTSSDSIEGAYVKDPIPGFKRWVVSLDATSLYPSFMQTLNISPETYLGRAPDVDLDSLLGGRVLNPPQNECWGPTGARFSKNELGVIPRIITEFLADRKATKGMMLAKQQEYENVKQTATPQQLSTLQAEISSLNNVQTALKLQNNQLYGALANQGFRFFNNHIAETITLAGQYVLRTIESKIDERLNAVFKTRGVKYLTYIDTDSLMFEMGSVVDLYCRDKTNEEITRMLEKVAIDVLQIEVNKIVQGCADNMNVYQNRIFFKLEKVASAGVFIAKKRYAVKIYSSEGVTYSKPKIAATGLDMVKSSTPLFIRDKLKTALGLVFDSDEGSVREYIRGVRGEFDKLSVNEIAFPRGVSDLEKYMDATNIYKKGAGGGTPINVRASLLYNSLLDRHDLVGKYPKITSGSKIRYVFLKLPNTLRENIIAFPADSTLPPEFNLHRYIDLDTQWEKTMIASLQNILDAIGWTATEQSSLNDFFG